VVKIKRYERNKNLINEDEQNILKISKVCVVGCGGLGGYIIEMLGRLGVGNITAIDGDVFDESNLNRQILSEVDFIGKKKSFVAFERINKINPEITLKPVVEFLNEENSTRLLINHDIVIDALDKIQIRLLLQKTCKSLKIPLIHGAIAGWYGQVCTIFPEDDTLSKIYKSNSDSGMEKDLGNPSFTPALVASIQVSEAVKILLNKGDLLRNKILFINTLNQEYDVLEI